MKKVLLLLACVAPALAASAANITSAQAKKAVGTWVRSRPAAHMTARFGAAAVGEAETVDEGGTNLFHVVGLEGGGFVVTSTDDRIQPIIAFSDSGFVEQDERNPLWVMLRRDLAGRMESLEEKVQFGAANAQSASDPEALAQAEWTDLLDDGDVVSPALANGRASVSDVRVDALVQSTWNQSTDPYGYRCYNLYTPNNYVCGCVATALSQVMRFFEFPKTSVTAKSFSCFVDDSSVSKTMQGGYYDWDRMPLVPGGSTTDAERDAISKLCYDAGVAVNMNWGRSGSGAMTSQCSDALTGTFGYANAKSIQSSTLGQSDFERGIYANLDAGLPVILGITGDGGHAIVADGYGYYLGTAYTHLNLGWAGSDNAWYQLPSVRTTYYNFSAVKTIVYNIFTDRTGELLTGRVLDAAGQPISGAEVRAVNGSTNVRGASNSRGIYALIVPGNRGWQVSASAEGYVGAQKSVYVSASSSAVISSRTAGGARYSSMGTMGNSWGNDFNLAAEEHAAELQVTRCLLSNVSTSQSGVTAKTSFQRGETVYAYLQVQNVGDAATKGSVSVKHELLSESVSKGSVTAVLASTLAAGATVELTASVLSLLQNLSVGPYTYRATVNGEVSGEVSFSVTEPVAELKSVVVSGASSVGAGLRAGYACRATLTDGTVVTAEPVWTIDSGSAYAEIDQTGRLSAKSSTVARSVVIRATCIYNGVSKSGTKVVSITPNLTLNEALDNASLVFTTDSGNPWFGETAESHDGNDAAQSGSIGANSSTWFETTVDGSGTLSFWYKVSSEAGYDKLVVMADGNVQLTESGESAWLQKTLEFDSTGTHCVRWSYEKDVSVSSGSDAAWVDEVLWTPDPTPVSLTISGDSEVAAGQAVRLAAMATMSVGSQKDVTGEAEWTISSGASFATLSDGALLTALPSVTDRQVTVRAEYAEAGIVKSAEKTVRIRGVLPPPGRPIVMHAGAGDADAVVLAWSAADYATTYRVLRSTGGEAEIAVADGLTTCSYRDASAVPGVAYQYRIEAVNASGRTVGDGAEAHRLVRLSTDATSLTFAADASERPVTIKANASLTVTADSGNDVNGGGNVDWLSFGLNGETLTVAVSANGDAAGRSAKLIVTAGAGTAYPMSLPIEIFQEGAAVEDPLPDLAVTHLFTTASEEGEDQTLMDIGKPLYVCYGWVNRGDGEVSDAITHAMSIRKPNGEELFEMLCEYPASSFEPQESQEDILTDEDWASLPVGVYCVRAALDSENLLEETDKDNNLAQFRFAVRDPVDLETALDCKGSVLSLASSDDQWYGTAGLGRDGIDCAMTKLQGDGGTNTLTATLSGAGTLSFAYRVSTEAGFDIFRFLVDGIVKVQDSGEGEWKTASVEVESGSHAFQWIYGKDDKGAFGDDCVYLDQIVWTPKLSGGPAPSGFTATTTMSWYVKLDWSRSADALSYVIERAESEDGPWSPVANVGGRETSRTDATALGGVDYWYRIKAVYADGESAPSSPASGYRKISVTTVNRTVSGAGGRDAMPLSANCAWTAEASESWLAIDSVCGTNDCKLAYRFEPNGGTGTRNCTVTVTCAPGTSHQEIKTFTVTQRVPVDNGSVIGLGEATGCDLHFSNSLDAPWFGQTRIVHAYEENGLKKAVKAMRSAEISGNAMSRIEIALAREGTLTFWWGTSSDMYDVLTCSVDGKEKARLSGYTPVPSSASTNVCNWTQVALEIPQGGAVVAWEYAKNASGDYGLDAGYVSEIVWTPATEDIVPPQAWFDKYPGLLDKLGTTDLAVAAKMRSPGDTGSGGKTAADGSDWLVWMDYVCGTDPLDSNSKFQATITMEGGVPKVEWLPKLDAADEKLRNYLIYGKQDLKSAEWTPVAEGHESEFNFFKVSVEMQ